MTPRQVRQILTGAGIAMVLAEVVVILVGMHDSPWYIQLCASAFVTPAMGIGGAMLAAVAVASEDPEAEKHAPPKA